ncbi:Trm112 family protein [Urbifossiella limnaea]|uniref:Trm112 family protein n=1 Tax=Urbifossiella limnaea TaxID=2528023 RepID=UPI0036F3BA32
MDDAVLALLRCPLDPRRQATLSRDQQVLVCSGCHVRFPIRNGLPILVPDEGELPAGVRSFDRLPCRRRGPG